MEQTDKKYRALYLKNWTELKRSLSADLKGYVSEFDAASYSQQGVKAVEQTIERNKAALGDQYDNAMDWARSLPVYRGETNGQMLTVGKVKRYVSNRDLAFADVVTYRRGAGGKVTKWDIFSVEYNGVRYSVKASNTVDVDTSALIGAIADYKQMSLKTGSLVYYRGALYVYDGAGSWYGTTNVASASSPSSLTHLLRNVDSKMKQ